MPDPIPPAAAGALAGAQPLGAALAIPDLLATADAPDAAWQPFRPGIEILRLYTEQGGAAAALLRYAPGASAPLHQHQGYEHILVLRGAQQDDAGRYAAGTLLISPPGSRHAIASPQGCLVLAIWERPVAFK